MNWKSVLLVSLILFSLMPMQAQTGSSLPDYIQPGLYFFYNATRAKYNPFLKAYYFNVSFADKFTIKDHTDNAIHYEREEWVYNGTKLYKHNTWDVHSDIKFTPFYILPEYINRESIENMVSGLAHVNCIYLTYNITYGDNITIIWEVRQLNAEHTNATGIIVLRSDGLMLELYASVEYQLLELESTNSTTAPKLDIHMYLVDTNYHSRRVIGIVIIVIIFAVILALLIYKRKEVKA